ncbi:hypothetical protein MRX96_025958 [Rhipicephalus microplus]
MDTSNTCKRPREEAEGQKAATTKEVEEPPAKAMNVRRRPAPNILSERRIAENLPPTQVQQTQPPQQQPVPNQQTLHQRLTDHQQKGPSAGPPFRSKAPVRWGPGLSDTSIDPAEAPINGAQW